MITHQIELQISRPVEDVFAYLTTASNYPKWDATAVVMEAHEAGAWHTGLQFHEVRKLGSRSFDVQSHIVVFEPNQRMELRSLTPPDFHGTWIFEPANGGTHLTYRAEMQFAGLMRLLELVIGPQFTKQLDANFANLKRVLESNTQG